jgi:hypothetical protein
MECKGRKEKKQENIRAATPEQSTAGGVSLRN